MIGRLLRCPAVRAGAAAALALSPSLSHAAPPRMPATIAEAARAAYLSGCLLHVLKVATIDDKRPEIARASGPQITEAGAPSVVLGPGAEGAGRRVVAKFSSAEGPAWVVAYPDSRWCLIYAIGGDLAKSFKTLRDEVEAKESFFGVPTSQEPDPVNNSIIVNYRAKSKAGDQIGIVLMGPLAAGPTSATEVLLIAFPDK